jgi:ClpP class serine protease
MLAVRDGELPLKRGYAVTDSGVAVVPIVGPMVARGDWLTELFGFRSYGDVAEAVAAAFAAPSARAVLLELDSPGGEVGGLFDLVDRLADLRAEAGKPLWAVASESALSAGFAIASAADRLYVTRTAEVGSVGVVAIHVDESAADAMAGLKWTLIHAGQRKVDGNPHEPLSAEALADIQADVDALHDELVALIAQSRHEPGRGPRNGGRHLSRPARHRHRLRRPPRQRRAGARRPRRDARSAGAKAVPGSEFGDRRRARPRSCRTPPPLNLQGESLT